jgi:hypothetical protein
MRVSSCDGRRCCSFTAGKGKSTTLETKKAYAGPMFTLWGAYVCPMGTDAREKRERRRDITLARADALREDRDVASGGNTLGALVEGRGFARLSLTVALHGCRSHTATSVERLKQTCLSTQWREDVVCLLYNPKPQPGIGGQG